MTGDLPMLAGFREIEIRRPQHPKILKWIDREFHVIWINIDADADANIICLLNDDEDENEQDLEEKGAV